MAFVTYTLDCGTSVNGFIKAMVHVQVCPVCVARNEADEHR